MNVATWESVRKIPVAKTLREIIHVFVILDSKGIFAQTLMNVPCQVAVIRMLPAPIVREALIALVKLVTVVMERLVWKARVTTDGVPLIDNAFHQQAPSVNVKMALLLTSLISVKISMNAYWATTVTQTQLVSIPEVASVVFVKRTTLATVKPAFQALVRI